MLDDRATVRRSMLLLAGTLTCLSAMLQLVAAVATKTLVLVTGIESILGLGPAVFLTASAVAAFPAGRAMDRYGRVPVLAVGCVLGVAGCAVTAAGVGLETALLVIPGFVLIGAASGTVLLARAAAADLHPPARRARGIALILVGALPGAAFGPLVFGPMLSGRNLSAHALVVPYLVAGAMMAVGVLLVTRIRPDPRTYAARYQSAGATAGPAAPLREILRRPGVPAAVTAAVASLGVMVSVMNLSGYVVVGHGHAASDVFTVISFHILGMYALVLVVSGWIDRIGRRPAMMGGLMIEAASVFGLSTGASIGWMSACLFGLGIGWNLAYVAAAAELSDAASAVERGRLLGFTDLLSAAFGATLALAGGAVYAQLGVAALALGAAAIAFAPVAWMVARPPRVALGLED